MWPARSFAPVPGIGRFCGRFPNLTYTTRLLGCETNFVLYGMRWFNKQGTRRILMSLFSMGFAITTSLYMKAPMLTRLPSLLSLILGITLHSRHRRIRYAITPLITQI